MNGSDTIIVLANVADGASHLVAYPCRHDGRRIRNATPIIKTRGTLVSDLLARMGCRLAFLPPRRTATLIGQDQSGTVEYKRFRLDTPLDGHHTIGVLTNHLRNGGAINQVHAENDDGTDTPIYRALGWSTAQTLRAIGIEWARPAGPTAWERLLDAMDQAGEDAGMIAETTGTLDEWAMDGDRLPATITATTSRSVWFPTTGTNGRPSRFVNAPASQAETVAWLHQDTKREVRHHA